MPDVSEIELRILREQIHSGVYHIYPKLSAPLTLTDAGAAYTLGSYTEIIPANTVTTTFFIMGAVIMEASSGLEYLVDIATGLAGSESFIGTLCFKYGTTSGEVGAVSFQSNLVQANAFDTAAAQAVSILPSLDPIFPVAIKIKKNTRIAARVATELGGYNCKIKAKYKL